ncbi:E2F-associated phosphoprotein [Ambystoma mexicanum]|uniref:E2F-associated phosphoprotein n=1 Tax=Ambystoma mexicanum TaxID=8296 RepID=UPI0037E934BE
MMDPGVLRAPLPTLSRLLRDSDPYELEEPSDEERGQSSSEDEVDVLLHGTPDQKRKLIRECLTGESESSSDDEFEKEMAAELNCTMKALEGSWKSPNTGAPAGTTPGPEGVLVEAGQPEFYDEVYFDSDSEDEEPAQVTTKRRRKQKHRIMTNDELLYDPQKDDRDQAWIDAKRRGYSNLRRDFPGQPQQLQPETLPNSDAILNCPACMTTLCLDCQRHESYRTQYRAMFVMNCTVNKEEVLKYQDALDRRKKRRPKKKRVADTPQQPAEQETETYHPVKCSECSTEVAVYDKDEVYHFFNVIASHC